MADADLKRTPLFGSHLKSGGRMVPFAGYEMPVQYGSIIAEAKAVRESAGMFDVSHMGRLRFDGPHAFSLLDWVTTNDLGKLTPGVGQYSLLTNDSGGCVDDIIVYHMGPDSYRVVVNASNHEKDVAWVLARQKNPVQFHDETEETVMIAVQGPKAIPLCEALCNDSLSSLPTFGAATVELGGVSVSAARSGYTGEDGLELIAPAGGGEAVWSALLDAGCAPCGLGARDTLRVEAGLPLYGHELSDEISPIAASLGWAISKSKDFIGKAQIDAARTEGVDRKLMGIRLDGKRLTAPGAKVVVDNSEVGVVSSGIYSPLFERGLALAFVDRDASLGTPCQVEVRGGMERGEVVGKRFYRRAT